MSFLQLPLLVGDDTQLSSLLVSPSMPSTLQPQSGSSSSVSNSISSTLGQIKDAATKAYNDANTNFLNTLFGPNYQFITGTIGLILVIAGIFLFRPVRETVIQTAKTGARVAAATAA
jgi:hypothetical protein